MGEDLEFWTRSTALCFLYSSVYGAIYLTFRITVFDWAECSFIENPVMSGLETLFRN